LHETLLRWAPPPVRVLAQGHAHVPSRIDPESGVRRAVGTPDSVQVLTVLQGGARGSYHFSGATPYGAMPQGSGMGISLYGSQGVLHYDLATDRIHGASATRGDKPQALKEIPIPREKERGWRVEEEFVHAIRTGTPIQFTTFETGVAYMEFT